MKKFVNSADRIDFKDGTSEHIDLSDINEFASMLNTKLGRDVERAFLKIVDQIGDVSYDAEVSLLNLESNINEAIDGIHTVIANGNLSEDDKFELDQCDGYLKDVLQDIDDYSKSFVDGQKWYSDVANIWKF